jgi:subtilisin family serine protease
MTKAILYNPSSSLCLRAVAIALACYQSALWCVTAQPFSVPGRTASRAVTVYLVLEGEPAAAAATGARSSMALAGAASRTQRRAIDLQGQQAAMAAELQALGAEVTGRFLRLANALRVRVTEDKLAHLAALPGVVRVERVPVYRRHLTTSVPFVGVPSVWSALPGNADGRGIRVGIIDSGIDYLHADFGGPGQPGDFSANDPTRIEPGTFPTAKVVGGFDFAGDAYNPDEDDHETPIPDPDPLDCSSNGHGTHVAGIVGGFGVLTNGQTYTGEYCASLDFGQFAVGPGVAPRVLLYALKVFGCEGPTWLVTDALEWAADPNGDFDFSDRLDVVNLSLGGQFGTLAPDATDVAAVDRLVELGCVVVCSAGNDGNIFFAVGAPGVAGGAISVANSTDKGQGQALEVLSPPAVAGKYYFVEGTITTPLTNSGPVVGKLVYIQPGLGCDPPVNAEMLKGNIALIDRGTCLFSEKILRAQEAGAIGVVMVNNLESAPIPMGGEAKGITIPGGMISKADGTLLKAWLDETITVRLDAQITVERPEFIDTLDDSSSRGPASPSSALKPEISAPGVGIVSAKAGSGHEGISFSGSSMASPAVAGAAALLRQLHPAWNVEQIKAALMNTAKLVTDDKGNPYPESRIGAGRLQVAAAAQTSVTAVAHNANGSVGLSFGALVLAAPYEETRLVRLTNHAGKAITYQVAISNSVTQSGVQFQPLTPTVILAANGTAEVPIRLTANPADFNLKPDATTELTIGAGTPLPRHFLYEASGQVWFLSNAETIHVPLYANVRAAASFRCEAPIITLPARDSTLVNPAVEIRFRGTSLSSNLFPLVSAFELGDTSPNKRLMDPNRALADLLAVGAACDASTVASFADSSVFFGLATAGTWTTPQDAIAEFDILIDLNKDGRAEFAIYNGNASATNSGGGQDVFMSIVVELGPNSEILSTNAVGFLNVLPADEVDTAPFNNSLMILSSPCEMIGLTEASPSFRYKVLTFVPSGSVDETGWIPFNTMHQVIDTTTSSPDGSPIYNDGQPLTVRLDRQAAALSGQRLPRILLLHHFGLPGERMDIVTLDLSQDDADHDGLLDWWEQLRFANLTTATKDTDSDGDGASDGQEYLAGTNPTDPKSVFKVLSVTRASPRNIAVRWSGIAGQTYALERSTNLLKGFTETIRDGIKATPPVNSLTDTNAAGPGPFFYRVRLQN